MIDVVFQMIIFFICTSEMEKTAVDEQVELEWARDAKQVDKQDPLTVTINVRKDGTAHIAGSELDRATLQGVMENMVARHGNAVPVVIRGDLHTAHRSIRQVMDICKRVGIWKLRFAAIKAKS